MVLVTEGVRDTLSVAEVHTDKEGEGVGLIERVILIVAEGDREGVTLDEVELVMDCGLTSKGQKHRSSSKRSIVTRGVGKSYLLPSFWVFFFLDITFLPWASSFFSLLAGTSSSQMRACAAHH